ncbi:hypothetical protein BH23ACT9_BH23ACT9_23180 [soil metagenome]
MPLDHGVVAQTYTCYALLMATMTRRLQILIDDRRMDLLEREAQRTGRPIAELIRDAVDARYGVDLTERRAAYASILAADPMPVGDWAAMKQELLDTLYDDAT